MPQHTPPNADDPDGILFLRARGGCEQSRQQYVELWSSKLCSYIARKEVPSSDIEDLVHDTLERTLKYSPWEGRSKFSYWIYRVANNTVRSFNRQRKQREQVFVTGGDHPEAPGTSWTSNLAKRPHTPEQEATAREVQVALNEGLDSLGDKMRTAWEMFHIEGKSQAEISAELGIPLGTVQTRLHHGRKKLRTLLVERLGLGSLGALILTPSLWLRRARAAAVASAKSISLRKWGWTALVLGAVICFGVAVAMVDCGGADPSHDRAPMEEADSRPVVAPNPPNVVWDGGLRAELALDGHLRVEVLRRSDSRTQDYEDTGTNRHWDSITGQGTGLRAWDVFDLGRTDATWTVRSRTGSLSLATNTRSVTVLFSRNTRATFVSVGRGSGIIEVDASSVRASAFTMGIVCNAATRCDGPTVGSVTFGACQIELDCESQADEQQRVPTQQFFYTGLVVGSQTAVFHTWVPTPNGGADRLRQFWGTRWVVPVSSRQACRYIGTGYSPSDFALRYSPASIARTVCEQHTGAAPCRAINYREGVPVGFREYSEAPALRELPWDSLWECPRGARPPLEPHLP